MAKNQNTPGPEKLPDHKSRFLAAEYEAAHQRDMSFMTARTVVKGWCFTILAGIFYFLADRGLLGRFSYHLPILLAISFFWLLELELASYQKSSQDRIKRIEDIVERCGSSQDFEAAMMRERIPSLYGKDPVQEARENFSRVLSSKTILCFYLALMIVDFASYFFFSHVNGNGNSLHDEIVYSSGARNYILSSISQGLAAILALVFAVALVMTQISSKYSIKLTRLVLSKWTILLMLIYSVGIVFPLIVMQSKNNMLLNVCVFWAAVCIVSLICYFIYIVRKFDPKSHFDSILKGIDRNFISLLEKEYKQWSQQGPPFISDGTGSKFWFNPPDDPLQTVLQIMITAMKDGDYETFTSGLEKIKENYCSSLNKDNERYLPFHFINVLNRCATKVINENDDFLLLQLCYTLRDIAFFNAEKEFSAGNWRISSLLANYFKIAFTKEDLRGIGGNIREIVRDIAREYVARNSQSGFSVHVSSIGEVSEVISDKMSNNEFMDYAGFIDGLCLLALQGGPSFNHGLESLVLIMRDMGIKSASEGMTIPGRAGAREIKLDEWIVTLLVGLLGYVGKREENAEMREFIDGCVKEIESATMKHCPK